MGDDPLASWMWMSLTAAPQPQLHPEPEEACHVFVNMDVAERSVTKDDKDHLQASFDAKVIEVVGDADSHLTGIEKNVGDSNFELRHNAKVNTDHVDNLNVLDDFSIPKEHRSWIWRVHPRVRAKDEESYEPKIVSIGPLHHGNAVLQPMEEIKEKYMEHLLKRSPRPKNTRNNYKTIISKCESRVRKQYAMPIDMQSKEFKHMLLVDACFMIEFFLREYFKEKQVHEDYMVGVGCGLHSLHRDFMLLENQIPFFLLEELFLATPVPSMTVKPHLMNVALKYWDFDWHPEDKRPEQVHHLLHLLHQCLKPYEPKPSQDGSLSGRRLSMLLYPLRMVSSMFAYVFYGLLYLLLINEWLGVPEVAGTKMTVYSATELHRFGVKFEVNHLAEKGDEETYLGVTFSDGALKIPRFVVGHATNSKLRNFIAFESCQKNVSHFTLFVIFLNHVICNVNDVDILRQCGILETTLVSDEQVLTIIQSLLEETHIERKLNSRIRRLFGEVRKYCNIPQHRWRASLKSRHLRSPWANIYLLIGALGVTTSVIQTYFSINRSVTCQS